MVASAAINSKKILACLESVAKVINRQTKNKQKKVYRGKTSYDIYLPETVN